MLWAVACQQIIAHHFHEEVLRAVLRILDAEAAHPRIAVNGGIVERAKPRERGVTLLRIAAADVLKQRVGGDGKETAGFAHALPFSGFIIDGLQATGEIRELFQSRVGNAGEYRSAGVR